MTSLEKHYLLLKDLELERSTTQDDTPWATRLDQKISDLEQAIAALERRSE